MLFKIYIVANIDGIHPLILTFKCQQIDWEEQNPNGKEQQSHNLWTLKMVISGKLSLVWNTNNW